IRALGEREAVVVGHGWGGYIAWTLAAAHPGVVRRLVVISSAHPRRWTSGLAGNAEQRRVLRDVARFQLPWLPERWLVDDDARNVGELMHGWAGPGFPDTESERRYRDAMQILSVPHCALE